MPHVITQPCCNDASCVPVCPVGCIHPTPDEPGYAQAEMLYIDPDVCIDCGACLDVCPVEAIVPDDELEPAAVPYLDINALHFERASYGPRKPARTSPVIVAEPTSPLRVAVVGSGPAACYAAEELLAKRGLEAEVTMFERLPTPWGLVRSGVAPDHPGTKAVTEQFERTVSGTRLAMHLNVEIGRDLTHEDLLRHHHAVIYATGASTGRTLGVPGEDLPGSAAATDFVGWYNGHPDFADQQFDLSGERAVVVGNGNVALDVARILVADADSLARTDIAQHALDALASSTIKEVVVLGRRGSAQAAYTTPELLALGNLSGIDVLADPAEASIDEISEAALEARPDDMARFKAGLAQEYALRPAGEGRRGIRLRYQVAPIEVLGTDRVSGLRVARTRLTLAADGKVRAELTDTCEEIGCGLVLGAIGYRGRSVADVPFDDSRGVIPNEGGRVLDASGAALSGVYVAGWIKRGPSGVIGTNKWCAGETVRALIDDFARGALAAPTRSAEDLARLVAERRPEALGHRGWRAIDRHEVEAGRILGRPRTKLVDVRRMVDVAVAGSSDEQVMAG